MQSTQAVMLWHMVSNLLGVPNVLSARTGMETIKPPIWTSPAGQLTHITVALPGTNIHKLPSGEYSIPDTLTLHEAIKTSKDVDTLALRILFRGGRNRPDRWSLPFNLEGGETYPPIKNLCLEGYHFDDSEFQSVSPPGNIPFWDSYGYLWHDWIWSGQAMRWWKWRQMPPEQHLKTNAALWADAMDWSQLQSLELRQFSGNSFIKHIGPHLTGLKEITLDRFSSSNTIDWLTTLPPLKSITLRDSCHCTPETRLHTILQRHGSTLETLAIHPTQTTWQPHEYTTHDQIATMKHTAPKLTSLTIAIHRNNNNTWPYETLEAIATIPTLRKAEIWMQLITKAGFLIKDHYFDDDLNEEVIIKTADDNDDDDTNDDNHDGTNNDNDEDNSITKTTSIQSLYQTPVLDQSSVTELWKFMTHKSQSRLHTVSFRAGDFRNLHNHSPHVRRWADQQRIAWICDAKNGCREFDRNVSDDDDDDDDVFERRKHLDNERLTWWMHNDPGDDDDELDEELEEDDIVKDGIKKDYFKEEV